MQIAGPLLDNGPVRWIPINASDAEGNTFNASREGMAMGWTGTFEQLAEYLAKA